MQYVYVMRCVNEDMTSYHGQFKWRTEGYVEAPDWDPTPECGNGLHGFLWGEGGLEVARYNDRSKWLVIKVAKEDIVDLGGKVKFPRGEVVFCGSSHEAATHIASLGANGRVHFVHREGGNKVDLVGGNYAILKAGDDSRLTAGYHSTLMAGHDSMLTAGTCSNLTAGNESTLTARNLSTLTAGHDSTLTASYHSTLTAGLNSVLISWCVDTNKRVIATVGQDGIEPHVTYTVKDGKFVPA